MNFRPFLLDRILLFFVICLVLLTPLPFGSVQPWFQGSISISIFLMGIIWCVGLLFLKHMKPKIPVFGWTLLILLILAASQILPIPSKILSFISPETLHLYKSVRPRQNFETISLYPYGTTWELCKTFSLFLFYFIVVNLEGKHILKYICYSIIIAGLFEAAHGLINYNSNQIFGYHNIYSKGFASGTFINRNHYAAFLEMCIFVSLGVFLSRMQKISKFHHSLKESILSLFQDKNLPFLFIPFCAFLMILALVFSGSRGGMIAIAISFLVYLILMTTLYKSLSLKIGMFLFLIFVFLACFWMSYGHIGDFLNRFQELGGHFQARKSIWKDSLAMASDFKIFGIGLGAYQYILPSYFFESHLLEYIHHAHNEYIEILCETGLPGFFVVIVGGALTCWRILLKKDLLRWGILAGVISVSLHNLVDFNLRIPANALLYILLFALLQIKSESRNPE